MKQQNEGFFGWFKMKYFGCQKGGEHDGELLNYVCVDEKCNNVGLLCSICREDHEGHAVYPLKAFLSKLSKTAEQPLDDSESFQVPLEQLDAEHKMALLDLRNCVETLAERFKLLEVHVNQEYSRAKIQLLEEVQINMKLKSFLKEALNSKVDGKEEFIRDMQRICSMVEVNPETKEPVYEMDLSKVSKGFSFFRENLSKKLASLAQFMERQDFSTEYKRLHKNSEPSKIVSKIVEEPKKQSITYTFSETIKASKIEVDKNGKHAKQTMSGGGRFVLVNEGIGDERQKVAFKVTELKNWVGLGVALKEKIKALDFKFEYNNVGHGSYLVSSNGYTWSHSVKQKNISGSDFKIEEGDMVEVELEPGFVRYFNKTKNLKENLKITDNKSETSQFCFCANLCSEGDGVQILD